MTENTAEAQETPAEAPETPQEASPNREAAKYRLRLREAEAERDQIRAELTAARTEMLRTAVDGYKVGMSTFNADALDDAGLEVESLFVDGKLHAETLEQTMTQLRESKPYMFTEPQRLVVPGEGRVPDMSKFNNGFEAAFRPPTH